MSTIFSDHPNAGLERDSLIKQDKAYHLHQRTNLAVHQNIGPNIIDRGEGIYLIDSEGNKRIDGMSGLWCTSLGYSQPSIAEAASRQMNTLAYCHTFRHQTSAPTIELAQKLIELAPGNMSKALMHCSGSEANDTVVKLVWYYNNALGRPKKKKIVSRKFGYHGTTVASASITCFPSMFADFDLPLPNFVHTDAPNYYRRALPNETPAQFSKRMAEELEQFILLNDPDTIAAFFAEPVMTGAGVLVPTQNYFNEITTVLRKYDVLLIADEVVCGFGRTANMWGCETFDIEPDIITCGKAISAGFFPLSAVMISEKIFESMKEQSKKLGSFAHGYTFGGHPVGAAVGLEVIRLYDELRIVEHVRQITPRFSEALKKLQEHQLVGDTRQAGLAGAFVLVPDRDRHKYFPPDLEIGEQFHRFGLKNGIIARPVYDDAIVIAPPLTISSKELDLMFDAVEHSIHDTWAWLCSKY